MKFTPSCTIQINEDVICRENQDGTVVVMKMSEDEYFYKIDGVAAEMWTKFSANNSNLGEIAKDLASEYSVESEKIIEDAQVFLNKALELKFITVT